MDDTTSKKDLNDGTENFEPTDGMMDTEPLENDAADGAKLRDNPDAHWPASIVGALVGMLVGTLPASLWALIFGFSFTPLYILVPLCVYAGIRILRGCDGRRGFILLVVFSLLGLYLTALSVLATADVLKYKMPVFNLPLVTITMIGQKGALPSPAFSAANVFPVVFTAIGAAVSYELLRRKTRADADDSVADESAE
jgi:hypothetical protein